MEIILIYYPPVAALTIWPTFECVMVVGGVRCWEQRTGNRMWGQRHDLDTNRPFIFRMMYRVYRTCQEEEEEEELVSHNSNQIHEFCWASKPFNQLSQRNKRENVICCIYLAEILH